MRLEIIFLTAVFGIAGIHLLSNMVNFLARFKRTRVSESPPEETIRDDWYVFFRTSTLYGDSLQKAEEPEIFNIDDVVDPYPTGKDVCPPHEVCA